MLEPLMDAPPVIDVKSKTILLRVLNLTTVDTPEGEEIYSVDWACLGYNNNQDYFYL